METPVIIRKLAENIDYTNLDPDDVLLSDDPDMVAKVLQDQNAPDNLKTEIILDSWQSSDPQR